jgi:RecA-family ATPase
MEDWKNRDYEPVSEFDIIGQARQALERPVISDPSLTSTPASRANLPEPVNLGAIWSSLPEVAPVLIDGVLRQGHKMIISAPSKAGKSFALMELAIAIAEGMN